MASVFLSYDREDADLARPIAQALVKAGHAVWWDEHIQAGAQYNKEIDAALKQADAVVVLWSERSVDSAWVRDEAAAGRDSGRLVPVALDATEPPLGFRQYHTVDLTSPRGRGRSAGIKQLAGAIEALGRPGSTMASKTTPDTRPSVRRKLPFWPVAITLAAVALAGIALFLWQPVGALFSADCLDPRRGFQRRFPGPGARPFRQARNDSIRTDRFGETGRRRRERQAGPDPRSFGRDHCRQ